MEESGTDMAYSGTAKGPRAIKKERVRSSPIKKGNADDMIRLHPKRTLCTSCMRKLFCTITACAKEKLMNSLRKSGHYEEALSLFDWLIEEGHRPSLIGYTTLLKILTIQKRFKFTRAIVSQVKENKMEPNSVFYSAVIEAFSRSGDMDEAIKKFWEMKENGLKICTVTFNSLILGYGNVGQHQESLYMLELMPREENVKPDLMTYSLVVRAWCSLNNINEAWNVVDKMVASGLQPCSVIYNTIVSAYIRNGDIERGEGVISEMQSNNVHPDQSTYDIILKGYIEVGKTKDALRFLYKMKDLGLYPNVVIFNSLIKGFQDIDDKDSVDKVLILMEESGVKPDVITYSTIMDTWSTVGSMDKCKSIFDDMVKAGIKPDSHVYSILAKGYVFTSQPKKAEELLGPMIKSGIPLNNVILTTIISGWFRVGKMDKAVQVFDQLLKHGISPTLITFETLIWGFGVAKMPGKAKEVLQLMKEYNVRPRKRTIQLLAGANVVNDWGSVYYMDTNYVDYEKVGEARFSNGDLPKIKGGVVNDIKVLACATAAKRSQVVVRVAKFLFKNKCRFGLRMSMVCREFSRGHLFMNSQIAHSSSVVLLS